MRPILQSPAWRVTVSRRRRSTSPSRRSAPATTPTRTSTSRARRCSPTAAIRAFCMQVFQKNDAILGGMDEAIAVLKLCSHDWDALDVRALHDGDAVEPWETVLTIEGDYTLFAHLETVYLGVLARRTLVSTNVRARRRGGGAEADPLLPGAARSLARADRRRLCGARRRRDRRVDRRAVVVVGRPRHRHGSARADRVRTAATPSRRPGTSPTGRPTT